MPAVQLAKLVSILERHKGLFDLRAGTLGADLCKAATDGVQATIAAESTPEGTPWAPLSQKYEEWKRFAYPGRPISLLHGTMDDPREVAGIVIVTNTRATVTYGRSSKAREEAHWFQDGGPHQPPRRFWGFTARSLKEVREILDARFRTLK
jgi:hypothetical protein